MSIRLPMIAFAAFCALMGAGVAGAYLAPAKGAVEPPPSALICFDPHGRPTEGADWIECRTMELHEVEAR